MVVNVLGTHHDFALDKMVRRIANERQCATVSV